MTEAPETWFTPPPQGESCGYRREKVALYLVHGFTFFCNTNRKKLFGSNERWIFLTLLREEYDGAYYAPLLAPRGGEGAGAPPCLEPLREATTLDP